MDLYTVLVVLPLGKSYETTAQAHSARQAVEAIEARMTGAEWLCVCAKGTMNPADTYTWQKKETMPTATTTARIHTLKLTEPESAVVRLALRLLATDAMQDWLDHERDIDPDHWSELAADLYRAIWGERPGSFTMADIKAEMESGTILT